MGEAEIRGVIAQVDKALQGEDIRRAGELLTGLEIGAGAEPGLRRYAALAAVRFLKAAPLVPTNDGPLTSSAREAALRLALTGLATGYGEDQAAAARELALVYVAAVLGEPQSSGRDDASVLRQLEEHLKEARGAVSLARTTTEGAQESEWVSEVVTKAEQLFNARKGDWRTFQCLLWETADVVAGHDWLRTRVAMEPYMFAGQSSEEPWAADGQMNDVSIRLFLSPKACREWTEAEEALATGPQGIWDADQHFERVLQLEPAVKHQWIRTWILGCLGAAAWGSEDERGRNESLSLKFAESEAKYRLDSWKAWATLAQNLTRVLTRRNRGKGTGDIESTDAELAARGIAASHRAIQLIEQDQAEPTPNMAVPYALAARLWWEVDRRADLVPGIRQAIVEESLDAAPWPQFSGAWRSDVQQRTEAYIVQAFKLGWTEGQKPLLSSIIGPVLKADPDRYERALSRSREVGDQESAKTGCFIATAVCGSPEAPEVRELREFRDAVLARSGLGRVFIATYYRLSPSLARLIEESDALRSLSLRLLVEPAARIATRVLGQRGR